MSYEIMPLDSIIKKYDALIVDLWGVVHDGYAPYENSINFVNSIIKQNKPLTFLSNSPRPGETSKKLLLDWSMNLEHIDIYTSGDAVREQLTSWSDEVFSKLGKKFYHLSESRNKDLLSGLDVERVEDIGMADFLLITAYLDDDEDIDSFDYTLKDAAARNLPAICANPDMTIYHGPQLRYTAGTISQRYENLGGKVYYYGKPYDKVYNTIINRYLKLNIPKNKILMIGDTLATDILGANNAGIDSTLVLTGNGKATYKKIKDGETDIFNNTAKPTWISYGMVKTY